MCCFLVKLFFPTTDKTARCFNQFRRVTRINMKNISYLEHLCTQPPPINTSAPQLTALPIHLQWLLLVTKRYVRQSPSKSMGRNGVAHCCTREESLLHVFVKKFIITKTTISWSYLLCFSNLSKLKPDSHKPRIQYLETFLMKWKLSNTPIYIISQSRDDTFLQRFHIYFSYAPLRRAL